MPFCALNNSWSPNQPPLVRSVAPVKLLLSMSDRLRLGLTSTAASPSVQSPMGTGKVTTGAPLTPVMVSVLLTVALSSLPVLSLLASVTVQRSVRVGAAPPSVGSSLLER